MAANIERAQRRPPLFVQYRGFSPPQIDRFRAAQRALLGAFEEVAAGLTAGVSEREARSA